MQPEFGGMQNTDSLAAAYDTQGQNILVLSPVKMWFSHNKGMTKISLNPILQLRNYSLPFFQFQWKADQILFVQSLMDKAK